MYGPIDAIAPLTELYCVRYTIHLYCLFGQVPISFGVMNRWDALVSIVHAFLEGGRPGLAFATIVLVVTSTLAMAVVVALAL